MAVLERHHDLVDELIAEVEAYKPDVDRELLTRAFDYAATRPRRAAAPLGPGVHLPPVGRREDPRRAAPRRADARRRAAPRHASRTPASTIDDIRAEFGDEIAKLVEGVTKLTRVQFQSREHAEAENYRKLIVAMAEDVRVILIKLADRLHNLRTIEYMGKQTQVRKARETLEVYAPLAHRLGIHALKWELEDLAFQTLHPRKYEEIKQMVAERRADREEHVREAALVLQARARQGRHARRDLRPREALLLDLRQDGQEGPRVQRDLRPDRDARDRRARRRRGNARLLRRARPDPLAVEADARPLQGLHRDAEVQPLPRAAHDRDRARGPAARDPGADARDARDRRVRRRGALALQARAGRSSATTSGRAGSSS